MRTAICTATAILLCTQAATAAELGTTEEPIRLAINEWTGHHVTTHMIGQILEKAGYKVEYVTAGYFNMWQAIADGDLHGSVEVWSSNVPDHYHQLKDAGQIVDVSGLGLDAQELFAYPAHVEELCPGLPDWEALKECAGVFATADTMPQGRLLDYPLDWGTPGAERVAALELPFKPVAAGSEGALVAEARASVEKKSPLLMVFWRPHWAIPEYDLRFVQLPPGGPECYEDPSWGVNPNATHDCDFIPTRIFKAVWSGFEEKWPAAYEFIEQFTLSTEDQEPLLGAIDVEGRSVETVVADWLAENEDKWQPLYDTVLQ